MSETGPTANNKKLGLALGGGGARGLAHIGVLKVLDREAIPVAMIAGTSMGAIVGSLYLEGVKPEDMEEWALRHARFRSLLKFLDIDLSRTPNLLRGRRIHKLLSEQLGEDKTFAELDRPFAAIAVDMPTGREVVLSEGNLVDAVRASMSVPGIFATVEIGDYRLIDGGVLNNVPADVVREMGADIVVAVDVMPNFQLNQPGESPIEPPVKPHNAPRAYRDLWHVNLIMISAITTYRLNAAQPDLLLRPKVSPNVDVLFGFDRSKNAIEMGVQAAEAAMPKIKRLIGFDA